MTEQQVNDEIEALALHVSETEWAGVVNLFCDYCDKQAQRDCGDGMGAEHHARSLAEECYEEGWRVCVGPIDVVICPSVHT